MTIASDDLNYCRDLAQRDQYPFYLISLFTPERTRHAWWGLLAFQTELAKIHTGVSNPLAGEIRLQWWRDALQAEVPPAHPVIRALVSIRQQFKLPLAPFDILIDARADDLGEMPSDAICLANYGRASTVPLLQLLLACEGWDAALQGRWFPWLDAIGTEWGQRQAVKIWPKASYMMSHLTLPIAPTGHQPYLRLLALLVAAEQTKAMQGRSGQSDGYSFGTLLKLWWQAKRCGLPAAAPVISAYL